MQICIIWLSAWCFVSTTLHCSSLVSPALQRCFRVVYIHTYVRTRMCCLYRMGRLGLPMPCQHSILRMITVQTLKYSESESAILCNSPSVLIIMLMNFVCRNADARDAEHRSCASTEATHDVARISFKKSMDDQSNVNDPVF